MECLCFSHSSEMDFCEQLPVGKHRRLPIAGSPCASLAGVLQKHLCVLPEPSDCTRTAQPPAGASWEFRGTVHRQLGPSWRSRQGVLHHLCCSSLWQALDSKRNAEGLLFSCKNADCSSQQDICGLLSHHARLPFISGKWSGGGHLLPSQRGCTNEVKAFWLRVMLSKMAPCYSSGPWYSFWVLKKQDFPHLSKRDPEIAF